MSGGSDARKERHALDDPPVAEEGAGDLREGARSRGGGIRRGGARAPDRVRDAEIQIREGRRSLGAQGPQGAIRPAIDEDDAREARRQRRDIRRCRSVRPHKGRAVRPCEAAWRRRTIAHGQEGARARHREETEVVASYQLQVTRWKVRSYEGPAQPTTGN